MRFLFCGILTDTRHQVVWTFITLAQSHHLWWGTAWYTHFHPRLMTLGSTAIIQMMGPQRCPQKLLFRWIVPLNQPSFESIPHWTNPNLLFIAWIILIHMKSFCVWNPIKWGVFFVCQAQHAFLLDTPVFHRRLKDPTQEKSCSAVVSLAKSLRTQEQQEVLLFKKKTLLKVIYWCGWFVMILRNFDSYGSIMIYWYFIHVHIYIYISTYIYTHTSMYIFLYIHIHTHISHTHVMLIYKRHHELHGRFAWVLSSERQDDQPWGDWKMICL